MFLISILIITAPFARSEKKDKPKFIPYDKDISPQLNLALSNDTRVYKLSSVEDMMNDTRRYIIFNFDLINYGTKMNQRSLICYLTSFTYRSALWDIFRYFHLRDIYVPNLEYELGYLTQEVIYHYQVMLEIYQMVDNRYIKHSGMNYAPVNLVFYLYTNLLEKSKIIIHLCNMMHELEEKHRKTRSQGVFAEYDSAAGDSGDPRYDGGSRGPRGPGGPGGSGVPVVSEDQKAEIAKIDQEKIAYQKWLNQKAKEEKKQRKEQKEYQKEVKKFGMTTKRTKRIGKKGKWPLDYGWSIETW